MQSVHYLEKEISSSISGDSSYLKGHSVLQSTVTLSLREASCHSLVQGGAWGLGLRASRALWQVMASASAGSGESWHGQRDKTSARCVVWAVTSTGDRVLEPGTGSFVKGTGRGEEQIDACSWT